MKTVLFFYRDTLLNRDVCDAYVTNDVDHVIEWRRKCLNREIKEGFYQGLTITIVDKLDLTMHLL